MDNETPSPQDENKARIQNLFVYVLAFCLVGLFLLFTYLFYRENIQKQSFAPTPNQIATIINVSPDINLIGTPHPTYISTAGSALPTSTDLPTSTESPTQEAFTQTPTATKAVYYVSQEGSDDNPGSFEAPWKTISSAAAKLLPGETLYIRGGIYQQAIKLSNSGTSSDPITITNYDNEEVIIDGNNNTLPGVDNGTPLVSILGDWVIFQNITVQYSGDSGVYTKGEHITLDNLYVHHNRHHGVILTGNYDLIQNSRIWYNSTINENGQSTVGNAAGVSCGRYPEHCTIRKSVVWENWGEGIATFEAMYTTIEGNISYDNQQNFYISDTKYSIMQGNISYCSANNAIDSYETQNGILVGDEKGVPIPLGLNGERYSSSDNTIINNIVIGCNHNLAVGTSQSVNNLYAFNTFVDSSGSANEQYNVIFYSGTATNARFENNIIIQDNSRGIAIYSGSGIIFRNNFWSKDPPSNMLSEWDIVGDPLLSREGQPYMPEWFALTESSTAINQALVITEVTTDFYGNPRGDNPDMGAIEFIIPQKY